MEIREEWGKVRSQEGAADAGLECGPGTRKQAREWAGRRRICYTRKGGGRTGIKERIRFRVCLAAARTKLAEERIEIKGGAPSDSDSCCAESRKWYTAERYA